MLVDFTVGLLTPLSAPICLRFSLSGATRRCWGAHLNALLICQHRRLVPLCVHRHRHTHPGSQHCGQCSGLPGADPCTGDSGSGCAAWAACRSCHGPHIPGSGQRAAAAPPAPQAGAQARCRLCCGSHASGRRSSTIDGDAGGASNGNNGGTSSRRRRRIGRCHDPRPAAVPRRRRGRRHLQDPSGPPGAHLHHAHGRWAQQV